MKQPFQLLAAVALLLITSCGRKNIPSKTEQPGSTTTPVITIPEHNKNVTEPPLTNKEEKVVPEETEVKKDEPLPMIVIDGMGNVITPKEKLPQEIAAKVDYRVLSRAFTPHQRTNLIYRYKIIPPRILFVPEKYITTSARGKYIIYRKKFWYWQKKDGLFYLDETYYK